MNHWMTRTLRGAMMVTALTGGLGASGIARAQPLVDPPAIFGAAPGFSTPPGAPAPPRVEPGPRRPAGGCFRHSGCGAFTAGLLPLSVLALDGAAQDAARGLRGVAALCATDPRPGAGLLLARAQAISRQRLCAGLRHNQAMPGAQSATAPHAP
jgi:hypothetical protein